MVWLSRFSSFARAGGIERHGLARIVRRGVESEQQRAAAAGRHVVSVANTSRNDDQVADRGGARVGAGGHDDAAFEDIELVVGVGMEVQAAAARDLDVVHARIRRGMERPDAHRGGAVRRAVAKHVGAVDHGRGTLALAASTRRRELLGSGRAVQPEAGQEQANRSHCKMKPVCIHRLLQARMFSMRFPPLFIRFPLLTSWRAGWRAKTGTAGRAAAERRKVLVDAGAQLFAGEHPALVGVPSRKPFGETLCEFVASNLPILVGVQRLHKDPSEEPARAESTRPAAAAETEFTQCLTFRFAGDLIYHGLRANFHERLDRFGWRHETARPAKARASSAFAAARPRTARWTAETRWCDRFSGDHGIETRQFGFPLCLDRGPDRGGEFVHLPVETFGLENRSVELSQPGQIKLLERGDLEHAFEESILALPRLLNAQVFALLLGAPHPELAERVVEVPRDKLKLMGLGKEI